MTYDWKQDLIERQQREEKRLRLLDQANAMRSQRQQTVNDIVMDKRKF